MSEISETIKPLVKRARVKGSVSLDEISDFIDGKDLSIDDVLAALEEHDVSVSDSSSSISPARSSSQTSLEQYFQDISSIDLLEPEEEIELSKQIHNSRDEIRELCAEYDLDHEDEDFFDPLVKSTNDDAIRDLLRERGVEGNGLSGFMQRLHRHKGRYREAHNEMVEANLRLVVVMAKKYQHCGLSLNDLINEGNLGLMKAVDRFDYRKGYRFSTYTAWWIRQTILRAISNKGRTIRLPVYMNDLMVKWEDTKEELQQELGREPHMKEIADELNIDYEKAVHLRRHSQGPTSLDAPVGENEEARLRELVESDPSRETEYQVDEELMVENLWAVIDEQLTEKEKQVFIYRYGLNGEEELTLEEVGEKLDLTRERIRQIQEEALEKIRKSRRGQDLKEFLHSLVHRS
jgi:RNA polymerase sigma factor (sigma-70 family)